MNKRKIKEELIELISDFDFDYISDSENGDNIKGMLKTVTEYIANMEKELCSQSSIIGRAIRMLDS